jgi:signal transduction histidine kinase
VKSRLAEIWRSWRASAARDVVNAVLLTAALLAGSYGEAHPTQRSDLDVFRGHPVPHTPDVALLLVAAACLVLAVKRRYPVTVLLVSTAAVVTYSALGFVNGAVLLAPPVALFTVAQSVRLRQSLALAGLTLVALMTATAAANPFGTPTGGGFYLIPAPVAAAVFGGIALRNRRAYVTSIQARAEEETMRRIDEERLRIARELHDIVAHTMATINVQAGVAAHVLADNPAAAGPALEAIRQSSKDGLRELRAILNLLRQADEGDPTQPAPGLLQLETLISGACNAGLPVVLRQDGAPRQLPAATDLAAYRIVQESLTNVIKHAGPGATAIVRLSFGDAAVRIEITDTGAGAGAGLLAGGGQPIIGGHGIIGMRERAAAVAGTLVTGPAPGGGYQVIATLPCDMSAAPDAAQLDHAVAGDVVPGDVVPGDAVAGDAVADDAVAGDAVADDAVPGDAVAGIVAASTDGAAGAGSGAAQAVRAAPPS